MTLLLVLSSGPGIAGEKGAKAKLRKAESAEPEVAPGENAESQAGKPRRLSLADFIRNALETAPEVEIADWELAAQRSKLSEAERARFLPEAEVVSQTGIVQRARGTVLEPLDTISTDAYGPFTKVDVFLVQPIFAGGKIVAGIEAATHAVESQRAARRGVAAEVVEQVKTLYYNTLLARSVAGIVDETSDGFASALETARERREQGDEDISELDILYLRVGRSEVAKELPGLRGGERTALAALRRASGFDLGAQVDIGERFLEVASARLESLDVYRGRLFQQSPSWKRVDEGVAAKASELETVIADFYPEVFLSGGFSYSYAPERDRQLNPFAWDDYNYLRGPGGLLGIRWGLNFHVTAARVETARAELGKLQAEARHAETGLTLELDQAYQTVLDHRAAVEALEDGRKAGRAILTLAVTNFDIAIGDASDVLQALGNYARVSSGYYESVRDYDVSLASLSRVLDEEVTDLRDELH
jgi:outer membrane protein TolC